MKHNVVSDISSKLSGIQTGALATLTREDAELAMANFAYHVKLHRKWKSDAYHNWFDIHKQTLKYKISKLIKKGSPSKVGNVMYYSPEAIWELHDMGFLPTDQAKEMDNTLGYREPLAQQYALVDFLRCGAAECNAPCSLLAFVADWKTRTDRLEE